MAETILTPEALADIHGICENIDDPGGATLAETLLDTLEARIRELGESASTGKFPEELMLFGNRTVQEILEPPWRIVYRRRTDAVSILGVFDRRRTLHDVLHERLLRS